MELYLRKTKLIPILTLLAAILCIGGGQSATINGYIVDATSGEPLPVVSVVIEGSDRGASTNLDGYFVIDYIDPGVYTISITHLGYHSTEMEVILYDMPMDPLHIEIQPSSFKLEEVEVVVEKKDSRLDRLAPVVSAVPLDAKIIRVMPSLFGEMDVLRALQTIPGVKASSDISSALYVRGGSPDQTLILMDHNVVYNPNHLFGIFSTFNADAVKHLDLMKGGFPAMYGGRSGSVLEVITKDGNRKKMEGLFSLGLISARASLEGPLPNKKGSYAGSLRRTYMEPLLAAISKSGDTDLPDYYFYDGNGKVNLDLTNRTTLTLAGYWGNDRLDFNFGEKDTRINMYMSWGNRTFSTRLRHALSRKLFWSVSGAVSRYRSKWSFSNENILLDKARGRLYDYSFKTDIEMLGAENHKLRTGLWISHYDAMYKEESEDIVFADVGGKTNNYSLYIQDRWRVHPMLELQPGLRGYYHEEGTHKALDPRLAMVFHYGPELRFKLAGGRYTQFMNVMSLGEAFSSFDIWFPIDGSVDPPYNNQIIIGFEWDAENGLFGSTFDDDLEMTTEVYYNDMHDIMAFNPMVDEGDQAKDAFVQGDGEAYGIEWMLRKKKGRMTGWLGYSLSWTKRQFEGTLINDGDEYYPKWDRRHDFIIISNYKLNRSWDLSASWRYNTGQGYTQALGIFTSRYAGHDIEDEGDYGMTPLPGDKNNYRFPADHRLDVTFSYNHLFFGKNAKLNISIFNTYSRRPYWQRNFVKEIEEDGQREIEVIDAKLLPVLPLISYEVRF